MMKLFYAAMLLIGLTHSAYAQRPTAAFRRDSLPTVFPPDVDAPDVNSMDRIPRVRPQNSFYRRRLDPPNVVRATLDNMPVWMPDTGVQYTMLRAARPKPRFLPPPPRYPVPPRRFRP